jgi:predicted dehydrogenase
MTHRILVYGGLGNVAQERIIPSLNTLSAIYPIEYATVDLKKSTFGNHYLYGEEPIKEYNAAIIATPNNTHSAIAIRSLESGLHILCEKPLANTLISANKMLQAVQKHPNLTSMQSDHYIYKRQLKMKIFTMYLFSDIVLRKQEWK